MNALKRAIKVAGGSTALAGALGISQGAVSQWVRCPAARVIDVEKISCVPREELRPDLYTPRLQEISNSMRIEAKLRAAYRRGETSCNIDEVPFHEQIKDARKEAGLSLLELAQRSGLSVTGVGNIERGTSRPKRSTVESLAKAVKEYRREMDTAAQWIEAKCAPSGIGRLRLSTLHKSYSKWALNEVETPVSRQKLAEALRERGYCDELIHSATVFKNIQLRDGEAETW